MAPGLPRLVIPVHFEIEVRRFVAINGFNQLKAFASSDCGFYRAVTQKVGILSKKATTRR